MASPRTPGSGSGSFTPENQTADVFQLQCQKTGQLIRSATERCLLIGSAAHCDCRLEDVPRIAAVAARMGDGWVLFDLHATTLTHNDTVVTAEVALNDGDTIVLGDRQLTVVNRGAGTASDFSAPADAECELVLRTPDGQADSVTLTSSTLIGGAMVCDVVPAGESFVQARHCLLTPATGGWRVLDLTAASGNKRNGRRWNGLTRLREGDTVTIGDLTLEFVRLTPSPASNVTPRDVHSPAPAQSQPHTHPVRTQPRTPPAQPLPNDLSGMHLAGQEPDAELVDQPGREPEKETETSPGTPGTSRRTPHGFRQPLMAQSDSVSTDPEVAMAAMDVFRQLKALHTYQSAEHQRGLSPMARIRNVRRLARAERDFIDGRKLAALSTMEELIAESPWNRHLILSFVRMCDVAGLYQLVLRTLGLLYRQDRNDAVVVKSMARVCYRLASDDSQYYQVCIRYWRRVQELCPQERHAIESTIRSISATAVVRRSEFQGIE